MEYMAPGSDLDWLTDVTLWLASGETVSSAVWTLETGLTGDSQVDTTTGSTLRITAAEVAGKVCKVEVVITTSTGNVFTRTWFIKVQEQIV